MSLQGGLPVGLQQLIDESVVPDKFAGLHGPLTVEPSFIGELKRIDRRLVLRWQPYWNRYAVFMCLPLTRKLWSQPVHVCEWADGRFKKPGRSDLRLVRQAHWVAQQEGSSAWVRHVDQLMKLQDKATAEGRAKALHEWSAEVCRSYDLSLKDFAQFGVTRGVSGPAGSKN